MASELINLVDLDAELQAQSPRKILKHALAHFDNIAISFSGAEDVVLVDMAVSMKPDIQVFTLDGIRIDVLSPDGEALRRFVGEKGLFSFYQDGHQECCGIRKIEPLRRKLHTVDAWITGQRKDQSPGTRAGIPVIQNDITFARPGATLTKFNPLANWSSQDVWDYIRGNNLPYNELHDRGFISIGCEPCTKPVGPGQHEREGRWWWEEATKKECGLHGENIKA